MNTPGMPYNELPNLPPPIEVLNDSDVLKAAIRANRILAELKGFCETLPNPELLLNTIIVQESKDSSAIENIVTTQDELYLAVLNPLENLSASTKEVVFYKEAIYAGLEELNRKKSFTSGLAITIMQTIKNTTYGFRKINGTKLINPTNGTIIYTPPEVSFITEKMNNWEYFINTNDEIDPLIMMAIMHYQFEAIHPFADGNGRTGRILNILYLVYKELLNIPVLYHSSYIIQHKEDYYKNLRLVTQNKEWKNWIIYMLNAIEETSEETLQVIKNIIQLKEETLVKIKALSQKLPAYELNELLFSYPYIKIKTLIEKNIAKRQAASSYLQELVKKNVLKQMKIGREIYFVNHHLMNILINKSSK